MQNQINQLIEVHSFLQEMRSTTSNTKKLEILKKHSTNEFLFQVFHYTYNPFFKYGVHQRNILKKSELEQPIYEAVDLFFLLDALRLRTITGHTAIGAINSYTKNLPIEAKEVFFHIIDRDFQMRASTSSINKVFKNCIPTFSVALAASYKPGSVNFEDTNQQWYGSRKLDGVRCLAIKQGNEVKFVSRSGKEFDTLDKVKQEILSLGCDTDFVLDGEMCIMNESGADDFQGIIKEIRRKNHTIEKPKFLVFDCLTLDEFESRIGNTNLKERLQRCAIESICTNYNDLKTLTVLEQIHLTSETQFAEMVSDAEKQGYEGIMVRANSTYEGKRSNNLLKVKKMHDEEYIVKRCDLGDMRFVENGKEIIKDVLRNIIIEHKGYEVAVGSGFSKQQREHYYANPNELLGKTVTIQYFEETQNQEGGLSLRFPVIKHVYQNGRQC
jgi:DNA ligase-1